MGNYIGVYGLGVMGRSLALNIARNGYAVSAYNINPEATRKLIEQKEKSIKIDGYDQLSDFVRSLDRPRRILLMITAGPAVDSVIESLLPYLDMNDMIMDCGNSYYKDTIRREHFLKDKSIYFFGIGVSGGEKGALYGPSIMPGGNAQVYDQYLKNMLERISAHADSGEPCCGYIGSDGAGHYVKMVHNGIEYGDIQVICEAYSIMKNVAHMDNQRISEVFAEWNQHRLKSYLIEITSKIMTKKDEETGKYLIDVILDEAGQKGTGKWTSMEALDIGTATPTITESVFARCISARKEERVELSHIYPPVSVEAEVDNQFIDSLEQAVYASKIISYAQGFALLKNASTEHQWNLNLGKIAMLWREGCIIRAEFLARIKEAFDREPLLDNLMQSELFSPQLSEAQEGWRTVVCRSVEAGIYIPAISASLEYFDGSRSENLPANLLQAQRDWFGAHTYRRSDRMGQENYHTEWGD